MKDNAKPGDVVELRDKESGFTDPETGFDISRDQKLELTDPIGRRTHEAIVSGGLIVISGKAAKTEAKATAEAEEQAAADAADTAASTAVVEDSGKKSGSKKAR
jgi:hypothetical protein